MSITGSLVTFCLRCAFNDSADQILGVIDECLTDHSHALPKALAKANERAWQAFGLALAGDSLFDRVKDVARDGDLKGVRDQIKKFLELTPTGLEGISPTAQARALDEWHRLRKAGRFTPGSVPATEVTRLLPGMERYSDPARLTAAAHQAVANTAAALRDEAPHLAELLTASAPQGSPLLVSAFTFFFRREVETNDELARGLSFDSLRQISSRQERGFAELEASLGAHAGQVLDRLGVLFDILGDWFESANARLDDINAKLDRLVQLRDVPTSASSPLKVTVTNRAELEFLQSARDQFRTLPPELIDTTDWSRLGDTLAAAGLFREAGEAHGAAAAAAKAVADRQAEAEAEYKRFRDACETGDRSAAMSAFRRAVDIGPEQFAPFDLHRYKPEEVLGSGGFGTVFLAEDVYVRVDKERRPQKVAIKAFHDAGWDAILERDLAESFDEADTLSTLSDAGIVKSLNRGFGDPARRKRPYIVMEYFPGVTLEAWLKARGTLPLRDVLAIAEQVAKAVSEAHRLQILHRDLKPANVMVRFSEATRQWEVKVIDFGLAVKTQVARTSTGVPSNRRAALDRSLAGTFRYSPPEQRNELEADVGPYSDVYAFGKTCLDLLFATTEPKSLHWKRLPPEHRDRVQSLFEQATVDELEHRFQNFEPVRNELAGLLRDLSADGPTHEPTRDEPTPARDSGNSGAPKPKTDRAARPDVKPAPAPDPAPDSNQTAKSARERREPPRPPLTIWERVRQLGGSPAKRVIAGAPFSKAGEETAEEGSRNLLCPNCHSPLGVPDIYAGQLMKCPLCKQNFTVPSLPGSAATVDPPGGRRTDPSQSSSKSDVVTTEQDRMNLLCPSCDNVLTVPKQYAGQMMKCPVCMNNFTVPKPPPT